MAHTRHISTTTQALFRVFVQPTIAAAPSTPRAASSLIRPSTAPTAGVLFAPAFAPHNQRRTAIKYRAPVERTTPYDEEIGSRWINLVDADGVFHPRQSIRKVLDDMDRITNHLVQVVPAQKDAEFPFPVCKVVAKNVLREQERQKEKQRAKKTPDELGKTLELNWAASPNDLQHWLKRLKEFLQEGRRVEVVLGPKKRGRKATPEEIENVLQSVKDTVAEVPGAKERIEPEGEVGGILMLSYDGPKQPKEEKKKEEKKKEEKKKEAPAEEATEGQDKPKVSRWKIKEEERRKQAEAEKKQAEAERIRKIQNQMHTQRQRPERQRSEWERPERQRSERERSARPERRTFGGGMGDLSRFRVGGR
ncbi:putative translation initiation factor protein [Lasiodiplodia theobromae]|uniref:Translation initiation factor protein n=1 Tax=Lasiodiplodia theobromae TaxID=45133 RepID=A0A8H7MBK6_9PEZI|nr:putative translation initiation factor protein [Lasiodiplodia theobromae]